MAKVPLRLLLIEDSDDDAELLLRELRRGGYEPDYLRVQDAEAMTAALAEHEWNIILTDYNLPCFSALAALELLQNSGRDIPFIIVSGSIGEEGALIAMRAGAHDYMRKSEMRRLIPSIERTLRETRLRREHHCALKGLRLSEERFRQLA